MEQLLADDRVMVSRADQCQYGLTSPKRDGTDVWGPAMKATGFASNSWCLVEELGRICNHGHDHVHVIDGRPAEAAT